MKCLVKFGPMAANMKRRKQTVQGECFMNERQPNSPGHKDHSEWQRRKTRMQWLMWPSTQSIGKLLFFHLNSSRCNSWGLLHCDDEYRHDELAAMDLSMIAVALTPSWLVWIFNSYASLVIFFIIPVFSLFCFWTRNLYTIRVLAVFDCITVGKLAI